MNTSLRKTGMMLAVLGMLLAGNLQAALINFTVSGTVHTVFSSPNGFGLEVGDSITAMGTYDDTGLSGSGNEFMAFGSGSGNSMDLFVGTMTFSETDDTDYASGFPHLLFDNGVFAGINFDTSFGNFGFFNAGGELLEFSGDDDNLGLIFGTWDTNSFTATVVPVPAAVWLLGSGLLGLVGIARRKART